MQAANYHQAENQPKRDNHCHVKCVHVDVEKFGHEELPSDSYMRRRSGRLSEPVHSSSLNTRGASGAPTDAGQEERPPEGPVDRPATPRTGVMRQEEGRERLRSSAGRLAGHQPPRWRGRDALPSRRGSLTV
jgi:hypothetical protein